MTFQFQDTPVFVCGKDRVYVATTPEGDCVTILNDAEKVERQVSRGIWDDCFLYRVSESRGVELVGQPTLPRRISA